MIALEKAGLPTVAIVAHGFEDDFEASAQVFGLPQVPYVVVPYTMTSRNREEAAMDVDEVFDGLAKALVTQPERPALTGTGKVLPAEQECFKGADRLEGWGSFNREFLERGLGDGFPLVAPTPQLVDAFLQAAGKEPLEVVGHLAPANGVATVERIAINAAMAGCQPEHLPILIAAVEAITQTPQSVFPVRTIAMSTGPHAMMMLVNGPIVKRLGINYGRCTLGPGKPGSVNTALGRALRLILMNIGHSYPGEGDMDTIGSPLKYSMCIAENEDENPWEPFHVERGFQREQSTVTIFGTMDVIHNANYQRNTDQLLLSWAARASTASQYHHFIPTRLEWDASHFTMLMCPDHARNLKEDGHTKESIREFVSKNAVTPLKWVLASSITSLDALPSDAQWILQTDP
ncbi:MAG: hypothetical protein V3S37_07340, partial [Dehalococcoidia bacterium]